MLILTRYENQRIFIGEGISITIVQIEGRKVRVGIECDKGIPIYREEISPADHPLRFDADDSVRHNLT